MKYIPTIQQTIMPRKKTTEEFKQEARKKHGDRYVYDDYKGNDVKIDIFCKACNKHFLQTPHSHISGHGCQTCGGTLKLTIEEFIIKATKVHEGIYEYKEVDYKGTDVKIDIFCKACNEHFPQTPNNHLKGQGCPTCAILSRAYKLQKTYEQFVTEATNVHEGIYGYGDVEYNGANTKVNIFCKACNNHFPQTPASHITQKQGCPTCSSSKGYSDMAIEWLEIMMTEHKIYIQHALNGGEYKIPGTRYKADGVCIETNTIYEFHGSVWHGDPRDRRCITDGVLHGKTFQERYENTQKRKQELIAMGYNYVEMWEYDWKKDRVL